METNNLNNSGKRLKYIIKKTGLKQKELCEKVSITTTYMSLLVNEKKEMSEKLAKSIESATGYSAGWLLTGEGEQKVSKDSEFITRQEFEEFSKMYLITNPPDKDDEDFLKEVVPKLKLLAAKKGMTVYQYVSEILENDI